MKLKSVPLDQETRRKVVTALEVARWKGVEIPEVLHRYGLLLTPDIQHQLRSDAISFLAKEMERWTPAEFLRRRSRTLNSATPLDMFEGVRDWIYEHAQAAREGK